MNKENRPHMPKFIHYSAHAETLAAVLLTLNVSQELYIKR